MVRKKTTSAKKRTTGVRGGTPAQHAKAGRLGGLAPHVCRGRECSKMKHKKSASASKTAAKRTAKKTTARKGTATKGYGKSLTAVSRTKHTTSKGGLKRTTTTKGIILRGAAKAAHEAKLLRLGSRSKVAAKKSASKSRSTGSKHAKSARSYRGK